MPEDEAGRPRVPWRSHPWFTRVSSIAAQVAAAALLATGAANSLAARKNRGQNGERRDNDEADIHRGGRGQDRKRENDGNNDREDERASERKAQRDGGSRDRDRDRDGKRDREDDEATDAKDTHVSRQQEEDPAEEPVEDVPEEDEDTGGGGRNNGGGGGNDAGNAGSGFFDSPLATKARRRANDFNNPDGENEEDGIFVDIDSEGESVYETDSISFASGPEGAEILTENITFFAEPTPAPTPIPTLELPVREPGFPFGENFPFGDAAVAVAPAAPVPADPGDTPVIVPDPAPAPAPSDAPPADSDGGDNTMDFTS